MKPKVILITNIISPYRIPVWNYIAKTGDFDFKIFFMKETEYNREWKIPLEEIQFQYKILSGLHLPIKKLEWEIHLNLSVLIELKKENPDIVILDGYDAPTIWLALFWAKLHGKKVVFWIGSTLFSSKRLKGIVGWFKKMILGFGNSFIAYGQAAKDYLTHFGIPEEKIFVGCNVCNQDFFRTQTNSYRENKDFLQERAKYSPVTFLFVGRFVDGKGIFEMLHILKEIKKENWNLILVGNGPLYKKIQQFIKDNDLQNKIELVGFKQQNELIKYYALSDIFIFPSLQEAYGIVVSEALSSGLFALSSKYAGATYDLIQEGANGYIIDPKNSRDFKSKVQLAIEKFIQNPPDRNKISDSIKKFTSAYYGQKVIEAVKYVL